MNDVAVRESVKAEISGFEMKPRTLDEAMKFCDIMANSDLVPKDYRNKPGNIMVAIQMGAELGMTPMRSLRSIAVINGRASQWGDDMLAMVQASPVCEYVREQESTDECGVCEVKRRGDPEPHRQTFNLADAKRAGLLGKAGTWQTNPARMLKLRARGFALRDKFADVLAGLITAEEAQDLPVVEVEAGPSTVLQMNQPLTLKDKLRAKVEVLDAPAAPTNYEEENTMFREGKLAGEPAFEKPAGTNIFDQSSALVDHETALDECKTPDELQAAWDNVVKDKQLTSESRPVLYKRMQKLATGFKAKK